MTSDDYKKLPEVDKDRLLKGTGISRNPSNNGHYRGEQPDPISIEEVLEELKKKQKE